MGLNFPASVVCDKCGVKKTAIRMVVDKLKPQLEMHVKLPEGWHVSSMPESGDLLITCPNCPPTLVSIMPIRPEDIVEDPATDPTLKPPPLPKI